MHKSSEQSFLKKEKNHSHGECQQAQQHGGVRRGSKNQQDETFIGDLICKGARKTWQNICLNLDKL